MAKQRAQDHIERNLLKCLSLVDSLWLLDDPGHLHGVAAESQGKSQRCPTVQGFPAQAVLAWLIGDCQREGRKGG